MSFADLLPRLGRWAIGYLFRLGHAACFLVELLKNLPASLRRFYLVVAQIHAIGNYSVVIIAASGLAVGFVLGLQGYYTLSRYGASESLVLLVAIMPAPTGQPAVMIRLRSRNGMKPVVGTVPSEKISRIIRIL